MPFKALLFLCAGSIIIKCHHEQDIRKIGGLRKYMPITYLAFLYASLSLIGFPLTSDFIQKRVLSMLLVIMVIQSHIFYFCCLFSQQPFIHQKYFLKYSSATVQLAISLNQVMRKMIKKSFTPYSYLLLLQYLLVYSFMTH